MALVTLAFVLASLCAYRLTVLIQDDDITEPLRRRFYRRFSPELSFWGQLARCPWCLGFWISVALWLPLWAVTPLPWPLLWPWAMSAAVGTLCSLVPS